MLWRRRNARRQCRDRWTPGVENLEGRALLSGSTMGLARETPRANSIRSQQVVYTGQIPFTVQTQAVSIPNAPALQGASVAQLNGKWLFLGGRTNGLHGFDANTQNFPPEFQNRDIIVINPKNGRVWTRSWADSSLSTASYDALTSGNQEFLQKGNRLYVVGGYGVDSSTGLSTTFDTLTSINVAGLMRSVIHGGKIAANVRQIHDPRLQVTGGKLGAIGNRDYLVMGQKYIGDYQPNNAGAIQTYTNAIQSFRIVDRPGKLGIRDDRSLVDPVNFHRRDFQMSATILPSGKPGITVYGGVFTPEGFAYRQPVTIRGQGKTPIVSSYQQSFSLYDAPQIPIYNARAKTMNTVFLGGISLDNYDPATGKITTDPELPFINTITTLVHKNSDGSDEEYVMPDQLPGLLGAEAEFMRSSTVPRYANGVIKLNAIRRPTVVGTMYGGILAQQANFGNSTASSQIFRIILVPRRRN